MLFALLISILFCVVSMQSSTFVSAQVPDGADQMDDPTPTPIEVTLPDNSTEVEPTATPIPTPSPTPGIDPGSPLSVGGAALEEDLSQLDIISLAQIVLVLLGVVWAIIILVTVVRIIREEKK